MLTQALKYFGHSAEGSFTTIRPPMIEDVEPMDWLDKEFYYEGMERMSDIECYLTGGPVEL